MESKFDAKKFVQLFMAGYVPRSKDEKKFVDKHVAQLQQDFNGNKDDVFKATGIPTHPRAPYHGYEKGQDERMYEEVEQIDEVSKYKLFQYITRATGDLRVKSHKAGLDATLHPSTPEGDAAQRNKADDTNKRDKRQRGIGLAAKKLAFGPTSESVEIEEEMTDAQIAKREEIVKSMKKKSASFKKRYGERAKDVMYATATKMAMEDLNYVNLDMTDEIFDLLEQSQEEKEKLSVEQIDTQAKKVRAMAKKHPIAQKNESVILQLMDQLDEDVAVVVFDNGEEADIGGDIAEAILNIFTDLSEENQEAFEEAISESYEAFEHAMNFIAEAYDNVENINEEITEGQPGKHTKSDYTYHGKASSGGHIFKNEDGKKQVFFKIKSPASWHLKYKGNSYEFAHSLKDEE